MTATFDADSAVARVGPGRYEATIAAGYGVPGGLPNGGYLTALAGRALADHLEVPDPLTVTTHYLASPTQAPVTIAIEVLKPTGRHRTGVARVLQGGAEVVRVTGTFTDLGLADGPTLLAGGPPELPPRSECVDVGSFDGPPEMFGKVELLVTPRSIDWSRGRPNGEAVLEGFTSLRGADEVSTLAMLFLADAVPPPIFNLPEIPVGWMPTMELTVHVRAVPAPGPLAVRFATRFVTKGYLELDGEMWDATGQLVGLSRQIALVPRGNVSEPS